MHKLGVDPAQYLKIFFMVAAHHHPIRPAGLVHSRSFCQKFRIGGDTEIFHPVLIHNAFQAPGGLDRHRTFADDNDAAFVFSAGYNFSNFFGGSIKIGQIRGSVQIGRRWQT